MASCWSREHRIEAKLFDALDHFPRADDPAIKDDGGSMSVSVARATTTLLIPDILPSEASTIRVHAYRKNTSFRICGWVISSERVGGMTVASEPMSDISIDEGAHEKLKKREGGMDTHVNGLLGVPLLKSNSTRPRSARMATFRVNSGP